MANGLHEVYYAGGDQDLVHVPPARVASATYSIQDLTESDDSPTRFLVPAATAATVDPFTATTDLAAGPGALDSRLVQFGVVAAPTVGRPLAIEHVDGRSEIFECIGSTTTTARRRNPFQGSYPVGSALRGVRMVATFPSSAAANADRFESDEPCLVTWTYTLRGAVTIVEETIRLERSRVGARNLGEVVLALQEGFPELLQQLAADGRTPEDVVRYASRRLDARLRSKSINTADLFAGVQGFELLLQRSVLHLADLGCFPKTRSPEVFRTEQRDEFLKLYDSLTVGTAGHGTTERDRVTSTAEPGPARKSRNPFVRA